MIILPSLLLHACASESIVALYAVAVASFSGCLSGEQITKFRETESIGSRTAAITGSILRIKMLYV
jgi:hypothetical protein